LGYPDGRALRKERLFLFSSTSFPLPFFQFYVGIVCKQHVNFDPSTRTWNGLVVQKVQLAENPV
jgi:hypothetical protein